MICTQPDKFSCIHKVGGALELFLNDLIVENTSLLNFYKQKVMRQFDVRSHVTQDLRDSRLF